MACCRSQWYHPLVRDPCSGEVVDLPWGAGISIGSPVFVDGVEVPEVATEDRTFHVEVWGDDNNGDGSAINPYATIFGALERIANLNPANFQITIDVGEGIWTLDKTIRPTLAWGGALTVQGERQFMSNTSNVMTVSNITGYTNNPNPGPSGVKLQYFDCDIDFSAAAGTVPNVQVGYFLGITGVVGAGANPFALYGLHKIIAWNPGTNVAKIRVWSRLGVAALPTVALTVSIANIIQTVFTWEASVNDHGLEVKGFNGGSWQDMVIEGNQNQFDLRRGIRAWNTGSVATNVRFGVHNFDVGLEVFSGGAVEMPTGFVSKIWTKGIVCAANAGVRFNFTAVMSGCGQVGVQSQQSAIVLIGTAFIIASCDVRCLWAFQGGFIDATNSKCYYGDGAGDTCLVTDTLGDIIKTGITRVGFTANEAAGGTGGRIQA